MEQITVRETLLQKVELNGRITFPVDVGRKLRIEKGDFLEIKIVKILRNKKADSCEVRP